MKALYDLWQLIKTLSPLAWVAGFVCGFAALLATEIYMPSIFANMYASGLVFVVVGAIGAIVADSIVDSFRKS